MESRELPGLLKSQSDVVEFPNVKPLGDMRTSGGIGTPSLTVEGCTTRVGCGLRHEGDAPQGSGPDALRCASTVRRMRDVDVRQGLKAAVASRMGAQPHLLIPEVDIRWSVPARADALLVGNRICGFEIKSDVDSLTRLPRQVEAYGQVVERAYLVVGERHHMKATVLVPPWWHIWVASWRDEEVVVRETRRGRLNPAVSPLAVTSFLSREQLVAELTRLGEKRLSSRTVDDLRLMLVGRLGGTGTMKVARARMLDRTDWQRRSLAA